MILLFLQSLRESGRPVLDPPENGLLKAVLAGGGEGEWSEVRELLEGWHGEEVLSFPGEPLPFHAEAAQWGAEVLFRAACFSSFREIVEAEVVHAFDGAALPDAEEPAAHVCADLCLRHLAAMTRIVEQVSEDDALVPCLLHIASCVPLSAVGMGLPLPEKSPVLHHPGLIRLLAERALERGAKEVLADPRVDRLSRAGLGAYASKLIK
ncbi:MAG: hypothetical protein AAGJ31_06210 [Verrucomicrobiota bacterium]